MFSIFIVQGTVLSYNPEALCSNCLTEIIVGTRTLRSSGFPIIWHGRIASLQHLRMFVSCWTFNGSKLKLCAATCQAVLRTEPRMPSLRYSVTSCKPLIHCVPHVGSGAAFTGTPHTGHEGPWYCRFVYGCKSVVCMYECLHDCLMRCLHHCDTS